MHQSINNFLEDPLARKGMLYYNENLFSPQKEFMGLLSTVLEIASNDSHNNDVILLSEDVISGDVISAYRDTHDYTDCSSIRALSYNKEYPRLSLCNKIIVLYEVNTFIRKLTNKFIYNTDEDANFKLRKSPVVDMYNSIVNEDTCKVIIASDRPVRSSYTDLYLLGNLLNRGMFPVSKARFFKAMKNRDLISDTLKGYIWYIPNRIESPFNISYHVSNSLMSFPQLKLYRESVANEVLDRVGVLDTNRKIPYESISMESSQSNCNYVYMDHRDKYTVKSSPWGKDPLAITKSAFKNLHISSPKFRAVLMRVLSEKGDHVIYSKFVDLKGIRLLYSLLAYAKINPIIYNGNESVNKYNDSVWGRVNTGDIDDMSTNVLLISDDAFERGSSSNFESIQQLDNITHIHMIEPTHEHWKVHDILNSMINYDNYRRIHSKTRNRTIKVITYMTKMRVPIENMFNDNVYISQSKTTDEIIHEKAKLTSNVAKVMTNIIKNASY